MFRTLKAQVAQHFRTMASQPLFYVPIDRDEIWQVYLDGFDDPAVKQEHTCNCCKSFLRQYGGIVMIAHDKVVSLWDMPRVDPVYMRAISNLAAYIYARPITDIFLNAFPKCGTDTNLDRQRGVTWEHFFIELPRQCVQVDVDTKQGAARDAHHVLKRSLDELTIHATETVLALIGDNALYRGTEHAGLLQSFLSLQKAYAETAGKDLFCWTHSYGGGAITRIRNTAIGTLLIDLSEEMGLDVAVARYERVVAPTNYKRPSAAVTPKMVEQAKETLLRLELLDSLERRYANETDLDINDVLFVYKPAQIADVFGEITQESIVNPRAFSKAPAVSIADFLTQVVPTAKSLAVLLEGKHSANFVTLVTAQDPTVPLLFKWSNPFSWSYTGGITDAIKGRVKDAGGNVEGELRVSLAWHNHDDLDLHVYEPNGNHIYYPNKRVKHQSSGMLDVDMNAGRRTTRTPVENIIWTDKHRMQEGTYKVQVHNYAKRETVDVGFTVQVECAGEMWEFAYPENPHDRATHSIVDLQYARQSGALLKGSSPSKVVQHQQWGLRTAQWHQIRLLCLSPNYWGTDATGNKHYFFMLAGCVADEAPRPFYNEFLKQGLEVHRKVFEILGSKITIAHTTNQLSGLGFSETARSQVLVQAETRTRQVYNVHF